MNWIPVEEKKPEQYESVIIWGKLKGDSTMQSHEAFFCKADGWTSVRMIPRVTTVTHWQPMPEGPIK